jgi:hypothetical protein
MSFPPPPLLSPPPQLEIKYRASHVRQDGFHFLYHLDLSDFLCGFDCWCFLSFVPLPLVYELIEEVIFVRGTGHETSSETKHRLTDLEGP